MIQIRIRNPNSTPTNPDILLHTPRHSSITSEDYHHILTRVFPRCSMLVWIITFNSFKFFSVILSSRSLSFIHSFLFIRVPLTKNNEKYIKSLKHRLSQPMDKKDFWIWMVLSQWIVRSRISILNLKVQQNVQWQWLHIHMVFIFMQLVEFKSNRAWSLTINSIRISQLASFWPSLRP